MLQIKNLHIEEFRGIRSIDIPMNAESFVVHGPNGSGKSGVVDAIDFVLTGVVHRLAGDGTGGVSTTKHAPHVHMRTTPASAKVTLTFSDTESSQTGTVTRSVGSASQFQLSPDTPELRRAFEQAQIHPEITLSRREIIRYVVAQPTTRAEQVQNLLQLKRVGEFRQRLNSAKNKLNSALEMARTQAQTAETDLATLLEIDTVTAGNILAAVNVKRAVLGVSALTKLDRSTDIMESISSDTGSNKFNLAAAKSDMQSALEAVGALNSIDVKREALRAQLDTLEANPALTVALAHRDLYTAGLPLIDSNNCPLCGLEWPSEGELREHMEQSLARSEDARALREAIRTAAIEYQTAVNVLRSKVEKAQPIARELEQEELLVQLQQWSTSLIALAAGLQDAKTVIADAGQYSVKTFDPPATVAASLTRMKEAVDALPDQSATADARSYLGLAKERLARLRVTSISLQRAQAAYDVAATCATTYETQSASALEGLYESVQDDFAKYYQAINSDDEGTFSAELTAAKGSLGLEVDFYGQGLFPPNAYHSEGHQDGMGVCLYLALMKHLLGDNFRLAVLDDVVMSVDVNHRRQFCELLKRDFPDVQFVITTHDEVWTRQMQSVGIGKGKQHARFFGWTVDDGPLYEQGDVWARIEEDLAKDDVNGAAHKLRRRMEAAAADIAENIGGQVAYKGSANYELGELLSAVNGQYNKLLGKASQAANSWNDDQARAAVLAKQEEAKTAFPAQAIENWPVNALVHNNDWAQMSEADFRPTLEASRNYLDLFVCDNPECGAWISVIGFPANALKCQCGRYSLNLVKKGGK